MFNGCTARTKSRQQPFVYPTYCRNIWGNFVSPYIGPIYIFYEQNIARLKHLLLSQNKRISTTAWQKMADSCSRINNTPQHASCCTNIAVQLFSYHTSYVRSIAYNFQEIGIFAESYSFLPESSFFRNHAEISLSIFWFLCALNVACNVGSCLLPLRLSNFSITCDFWVLRTCETRRICTDNSLEVWQVVKTKFHSQFRNLYITKACKIDVTSVKTMYEDILILGGYHVFIVI